MQNFGRGMWRRVGDYQKQQQQQEQETSRLMQYMQRLSLPSLVQLQKQRAIDAYNRMKKTEAESDKVATDKVATDKAEEVKEEVKEVTIVEIINDPECAEVEAPVVEPEYEVIRQPENVMNDDITVVDFISEAIISVPEETTTSKKKRKKNK